jgi:hypothetical protein
LITREWIGQILNARIRPRLNSFSVDPVDLGEGKTGFVISVSQTQTGPHQAPDHKYYKRYNIEVRSLEDHDIRDIMRRATTPQLYITFSFNGSDRAHFDYKANEDISKPVLLTGMLGNSSPQPAHYAMIRLGIAAGVQFHSGTPWGTPIPEETDDFGKINWIRQAISVPPSLPIFKELEHPLDQRGIALLFHSRTLGQGHRWPLVVEILCPGFSLREAWFVQQNGSNLRLLPPGHPLLR